MTNCNVFELILNFLLINICIGFYLFQQIGVDDFFFFCSSEIDLNEGHLIYLVIGTFKQVFIASTEKYQGHMTTTTNQFT